MLSSRNNPTIKQIRALRQRKERERTGSYWLEGLRLVGEAVELQAPIKQLIVAPDLLKRDYAQQVVEQARTQPLEIIEVSAEVFQSLSSKDGPQGLGAVVEQHWTALDQLQPGDSLGWIALREASDPGNLGTILRTSDAVGIQGIILIGPSTDPYDPATVRASMGAILSQSVTRTEWTTLLKWIEQQQLTLVGSADSSADDYQAIAYPRPLVVLMGSEREGLTQEQQAACHHVVRIPMVGRSDSLNLAVATSLIVYEIFNQQRLD